MYFEKKLLNYHQTAIELKGILRELKDSYVHEISDQLRGHNLHVIKQERKSSPWYVRITLPIALVVVLLVVISTPFKYMLTGSWGYDENKLFNWFRSVGL